MAIKMASLRKRFEDKIVSSFSYGFLGYFTRTISSDNDDGQLDRNIFDNVNQIYTIYQRHLQIGYHQVERLLQDKTLHL